MITAADNLLTMEPSGSRVPPRKPSFETGTRVAVHSIVCHVCFFCGNTFPVLSDYQRHIVHEHQMASIAYQLYAEEHPPGAKERSLKRVKSEDKKKKNENGDEKRQKMDDSLNTSIQSQPSLPDPPLPPSSSQPLHHPPITDHPPSTSHPYLPDRPYNVFPVAVEAQEEAGSYASKNPVAHNIPPEASPSQPPKNPLGRHLPSEISPSLPPKNLLSHHLRSEPSSPLLPPGRYPANKQLQTKRSSMTTPAKVEEYMRSPAAKVEPKTGPGDLCLVCCQRFSNGTSLITHSIKDHGTVIKDVEMNLECEGEMVPTPYEFAEICDTCGIHTRTLTEAFQHYISTHKAIVFKGTEATAVSFVVKCHAANQPQPEFNVNIRLKRATARP